MGAVDINSGLGFICPFDFGKSRGTSTRSIRIGVMPVMYDVL